MKIGLLREEKLPADKRVVFTPKQCKNIKLLYKNLNIVVQSSDKRCFSEPTIKKKRKIPYLIDQHKLESKDA